MAWKFLKSITFFSVFFIPHALFSHICIDVEEFEFRSEKKDGIRISAFNTDTQNFEFIKYFPYPQKMDSSLPFKDYNLEIKYSGDIIFPKDFDWSKYILYDGAHISLMHDPITPQPITEIKEKLSKFTAAPTGTDFQVSFYDEKGIESKTTFSNICANRDENNTERGYLGEMATKYTMKSFGYECRSSQDQSRHGFDGVFVGSFDQPILLLTESKCREELNSAKDYCAKDLSERMIHQKLQKTKQINTQKIITKFIDKHPQQIYKLAHRILPTGASQWHMEQFNKETYLYNLLPMLSPEAPNEDKILILRSVQQTLYRTPQEFLKACFGVSGLTKKSLAELLQ